MSHIAQIVDFDDANYDPFMEDDLVFGDLLDPYSIIAKLREQGQVIKGDYRVACGVYPDITMGDRQHYMVLGYDAVAEVFAKPDVYSNFAYGFNLGISFGQSISIMDAPDHTRYRRIFQKAFLPGTVAKWGETIVDPVVKQLMDSFSSRGKADLVQEFTLYYPFHIIYRQLNLPERDAPIFQKLAIAQTATAIDPSHGMEASRKLGDYFSSMIAARRAEAGDDLVSTLVRTEVDGEYLPEDVLISFFRQLINAAGDTTYRGTSVLLAGLLQNPDQLAAIYADRTLVGPAIEEALRWDGPVLQATRYTKNDVTLCGFDIPAGSILDVLSGSANRDPRYFTDPDKFDIFRDRSGVKHLSFAAGPHVCLGQHLARVEMTRALNALLDKLPGLRLDPDMPAPQIRGSMMRVPKHIYVRFDT
ncbi:MAG: cytochrome P450 [Acidocella sp.]|nr:cytochrome P450 [Acidocella sp.]